MKQPILLLGILAVGALSFAAGDLILRAPLTGAGRGKATWKTRDRGNQLQAELSGEAERLPRNSAVTVRIDHGPTFRAKTDALGAFHFSFRYLGANRPAIVAADMITVTDSHGTILLSGKFGI